MSDIEWVSWYRGTRAHAVKERQTTRMSEYVYTYCGQAPEWTAHTPDDGLPRCKQCEKVVASFERAKGVTNDPA